MCLLRTLSEAPLWRMRLRLRNSTLEVFQRYRAGADVEIRSIGYRYTVIVIVQRIFESADVNGSPEIHRE